jgi:CheY-like chemotaxis protein
MPSDVTSRVLVVDDEPPVSDALEKVLRDCEVDRALNKEDALRLLEASSQPPEKPAAPYDVVIIDMVLPPDKEAGKKILAAVQMLPTTCGTRAVILTGYGTMQTAFESGGLGADAFVDKASADWEKFAAKVAELAHLARDLRDLPRRISTLLTGLETAALRLRVLHEHDPAGEQWAKRLERLEYIEQIVAKIRDELGAAAPSP